MKITDTIIVINSSNRVDKVVTPALFPDDVIEWVIAVPFDQFDTYEAKFPGKVRAIPERIAQRLPSQRQYVMETWGALGYKYIWLMDDDLQYFKRNEELLLRKCDTTEIEEMFLTMREHLNEISMVGISTRLGNNRITGQYDEINRVTRSYAIATEAFQKVGATFAPFEPFTAEDFHMALCFLEKGYKNRILHTFAQEDVGGSNAEGGCSLYRTAEVQRKTSFWLAENHNSVSVKGKYTKGAWGLQELADGRNFRVDVIVQWKQAYKPVFEKPKGGFSFMKKK
jgi:hypothetical protein